MFGRECRRPIDVALIPPKIPGKESQEYMVEVHSNLQRTIKIARDNTKATQDKMKKTYDQKTSTARYRVGDRVWLYCARTPVGKSPKLVRRWTGPYYVARTYAKPVYKLHCERDHRALRSLIHHNRLKAYHDPRDRPTKPPPQLENPQGEYDPEEVDIEDTAEADETESSSQQSQGRGQGSQMSENQQGQRAKDSQDKGSKHTMVPSQVPQTVPEYETVEKVLKCQKYRGIRWYKVKWAPNPEGKSSTTWVTEQHIAPRLTTLFHAQYYNNGRPRKKSNYKR